MTEESDINIRWQSATAILAQGDTAFKAKNIAEAERLYSRAAAIDVEPGTQISTVGAVALARKTVTLRMCGRFEDAVKCAEESFQRLSLVLNESIRCEEKERQEQKSNCDDVVSGLLSMEHGLTLAQILDVLRVCLHGSEAFLFFGFVSRAYSIAQLAVEVIKFFNQFLQSVSAISDAAQKQAKIGSGTVSELVASAQTISLKLRTIVGLSLHVGFRQALVRRFQDNLTSQVSTSRVQIVDKGSLMGRCVVVAPLPQDDDLDKVIIKAGDIVFVDKPVLTYGMDPHNPNTNVWRRNAFKAFVSRRHQTAAPSPSKFCGSETSKIVHEAYFEPAKIYEALRQSSSASQSSERTPQSDREAFLNYFHFHEKGPEVDDESIKSIRSSMLKPEQLTGPNSVEGQQAHDYTLTQRGFGEFFRILDNNALTSAEYGIASVGAFASMVEHSCNPTTNYAVLPDGEMVFIARRDLRVGDPVSISYVDIFQPAAKRQQELRRRYGFDCRCLGACASGTLQRLVLKPATQNEEKAKGSGPFTSVMEIGKPEHVALLPERTRAFDCSYCYKPMAMPMPQNEGHVDPNEAKEGTLENEKLWLCYQCGRRQSEEVSQRYEALERHKPFSLDTPAIQVDLQSIKQAFFATSHHLVYRAALAQARYLGSQMMPTAVGRRTPEEDPKRKALQALLALVPALNFVYGTTALPKDPKPTPKMTVAEEDDDAEPGLVKKPAMTVCATDCSPQLVETLIMLGQLKLSIERDSEQRKIASKGYIKQEGENDVDDTFDLNGRPTPASVPARVYFSAAANCAGCLSAAENIAVIEAEAKRQEEEERSTRSKGELPYLRAEDEPQNVALSPYAYEQLVTNIAEKLVLEEVKQFPQIVKSQQKTLQKGRCLLTELLDCVTMTTTEESIIFDVYNQVFAKAAAAVPAAFLHPFAIDAVAHTVVPIDAPEDTVRRVVIMSA